MSQTDPAPFIGRTIGLYQIEQHLSDSRWGAIYRAVQTSIHRTVALKVLAPEIAALPGKVDHFLEESRTGAQITHAHIVGIYEAGYADGVHFCAMEFMDGPPLLQFLTKQPDAETAAPAQPAPPQVDEHHLLLALTAIAQALDFLWQHNHPHRPPTAETILVNADGVVKMRNLELFDDTPSPAREHDIATLGLTLAGLANQIGPITKPVAALVERMLGVEGTKHFPSLADLATTAAALENELFPPPASAKQRAIRKIQKKKTNPLVHVAGALLIILAVSFAVYRWNRRINPPPPVPRPPDVGTMVTIPAGEFIYQTGTKTNLPAFAIDKYEVTIAQYKEFLDALAAGATVTPNPFQPARKNYRPLHWDDMLRAIQQRTLFNNGLLHWDSPVFGVDWYDADAYARWRGKRLPTEHEWEKTARGTTGRKYPWGDTFIAANCNTAASAAGRNKWNLVYHPAADQSPYNVIALAGNVSEWTASAPNRLTAVVRGGSWAEKDPVTTLRQPDYRRDFRSETIGFRCASNPPNK